MKFEKLNLFFDKIKHAGFWQRIFRWREIQAASYDAHEEFKELTRQVEASALDAERLKHREETLSSQEKELAVLKEKAAQLTESNSALKAENAKLLQADTHRQTEFQKNVSNVNAIREKLEEDRRREIDERQRQEIARLEAMKGTWTRHQDNVGLVVKSLCRRHTVEYVDKVPFKGAPDNTVKICGNFVVFDAKSPSSDDLGNFPVYLKAQAEQAKKYAKEEGVWKDIFFVIPANTVQAVEIFCHNLVDYNVYVVSLDTLEPVMVMLKKLEGYEFAEQLTPEDRDNVCRVIGKLMGFTKRKIQVDQFFINQLLAVLGKCEADLPADFEEKVAEFERAEKFNPPPDRRSKEILTEQLVSEQEKIDRRLPLYAGEEPRALPDAGSEKKSKSLKKE